ncbi:hypothetical protein MTP99_005145 [Tenebrio molitor]|jgi:hypothetical protein|nr:hypothetical protein MTP99_005145 [Tenebrio molitor]
MNYGGPLGLVYDGGAALKLPRISDLFLSRKKGILQVLRERKKRRKEAEPTSSSRWITNTTSFAKVGVSRWINPRLMNFSKRTLHSNGVKGGLSRSDPFRIQVSRRKGPSGLTP